MKVVAPKQTTKQREFQSILEARYSPLLHFARPELKSEDDDSVLAREYKLQRNPKDKDSTTYTVKIIPFDNGSCEELLIFLKSFKEICEGQAITSAKDKKLLGSSGRAFFLGSFPADNNVTEDDFKRAIEQVKQTVFPRRAAHLQRMMLLQLRVKKPCHIKTRAFATRIQEINDLIPEFPSDIGEPHEKLRDWELLDVIIGGLPGHYQRELTRLRYDVEKGSVQSLIRTVEEAIESVDPVLAESTSTKPKSTTGNNNPPNKKRSGTKQREGDGSYKKRKESKDCMVHGENCGHSTAQCTVLKKFSDKYRSQRNNNQPSKKGGHEMNAMLKKLVAEESNAIAKKLFKEMKKRKKETDDSSVGEINVIDHDDFMSKLTMDDDSQNEYST